MNDKLEKTLKELLPYIIVTGIIFLLLPLFMGKTASAATYIIQLGIFPLTALGCGVFYKLKMKKNSVYPALIAPIFYALAALLYGMWRASWYTVLIYTVAYFLCGYLGQLLADVLPFVEEKEAPAEDFQAEDPTEDVQLDASTTEDDIETILNNIHNRK